MPAPRTIAEEIFLSTRNGACCRDGRWRLGDVLGLRPDVVRVLPIRCGLHLSGAFRYRPDRICALSIVATDVELTRADRERNWLGKCCRPDRSLNGRVDNVDCVKTPILPVALYLLHGLVCRQDDYDDRKR